MKNLSTFCSNRDAFYLSFLRDIDVYHDSDLYLVDDYEWREEYRVKPLVLISRFFASKELQQYYKSHNKSLVLVHGTWTNRYQHSWGKAVSDLLGDDAVYTFPDETWDSIHETPGWVSEFGLTYFSFKKSRDKELFLVVLLELLESVLGHWSTDYAIYGDKYEKALAKISGQSIVDYPMEEYPELIAGLTAAKYLPHNNRLPLTYGILISMGSLLRKLGRRYIVTQGTTGTLKYRNSLLDLLEIGDNLLGEENW